MSRRHAAEKRSILPDPKFKNVLIAKFINCLMLDGKKSVAEKITYAALEIVSEKTKMNTVDAFNEVIDNVKPEVEVKSRRIGGATYQVPVEVRDNRSIALAMRWVIAIARKRSEKNMVNRLANEMLDILNKRGSSIRKKEDTHKMAEANRAFAHYRW